MSYFDNMVRPCLLDRLRATSVVELYPTNGLISHWKLDEDPAIDNTVIVDSFGGNDGLFVSDASNRSTEGKVNKAISFFDFSNYIQLPNDIMNGFTAWSVIGWVKTPATFIDNMSPFLGSVSVSTYPIIRYKTTDQKWQCYSGDGSFFVNAVRSKNTVIPNTWYHIAMCYNGTNFFLYIDTEDSGEGGTVTADGILTIDDATGGVRLGGEPSAGASRRPWGGLIDDVLIYNRALTQQEITQIYNIGAL